MPARNSANVEAAIITSSFRCPACEKGVCDVPRPVMVISGGVLRSATGAEIERLEQREVMSWELSRLPGRGPEGLARLANGAEDPTPDGYLVTCTCGHLFRHELPD